MSTKAISYCITCKNRFHQISKTLPVNLEHNRGAKDLIEFVVADFQSQDGLQEWILGNFKEELEEGYLKYFYTEELPSWHGSIAKNTAHRHASGAFLINLDGDNYTGENGGLFAYEKIKAFGERLLIHQFSGDWEDGSYGRIGAHRKYFWKVCGYDESLEAMGHEDMDLINRLAEWGLQYRRFWDPKYSRAIINTREDSVKYSQSSLNWLQMEVKNTKMSKHNIYLGKLVANNGSFGITKNIVTYKQGQLVAV